MLPSLVTTRGTALRVVEEGVWSLVSNRRVISFTLGFPLRPAVGPDLGGSNPKWSPMGADADRYEGVVLKLLRAADNGGCLAVVPLPFNLNDEGKGRDSEVVAVMPLEAMSVWPFVKCCTPLYSL